MLDDRLVAESGWLGSRCGKLSFQGGTYVDGGIHNGSGAERALAAVSLKLRALPLLESALMPVLTAIFSPVVLAFMTLLTVVASVLALLTLALLTLALLTLTLVARFAAVAFTGLAAGFAALKLAAALLCALARIRLALGLVNGADNAEIMFGVLVVGFAQNAVAAGGSIARHLRVFVVKLLGSAAHTHFRPGTVKNMVAIQRNAVLLIAKSPSTATAAARAVVAATHALHVHVLLSTLV
jgi:hypothetical protein